MKKKTVALLMTAAMTVAALGGCGNADNAGVNVSSGTEESTAGTTEADAADGAVYKVGIVQFVDDASLNQIHHRVCVERVGCTCNIRTGCIHACYESCSDRIGYCREYYGNLILLGGILHDHRRRRGDRYDHIYLGGNQFGGDLV